MKGHTGARIQAQVSSFGHTVVATCSELEDGAEVRKRTQLPENRGSAARPRPAPPGREWGRGALPAATERSFLIGKYV